MSANKYTILVFDIWNYRVAVNVRSFFIWTSKIILLYFFKVGELYVFSILHKP